MSHEHADFGYKSDGTTPLTEADFLAGEKSFPAKTPLPGSLSATDQRSAAVQKTPWRVSLDSMKKRVANVEYIHPASIPHMTICVILLDNGYALQGMSAPADPANFNQQLGREYAYEDALKKMWPLEAYVMRDMLSGSVEVYNVAKRWGE